MYPRAGRGMYFTHKLIMGNSRLHTDHKMKHANGAKLIPAKLALVQIVLNISP